MLIIKLTKDSHSEAVVRKSLYWCDPEHLWTLESLDNEWVISVKQPASNFECTLHKHLNDFLLRERLDAKTLSIRDDLIHASLQAVIRNVNKT
jgi:His-Xaa-Ser system protein HxsD